MHFEFVKKVHILVVDIGGLKLNDKIFAFHRYEKTDLAMKKDG